MTLASAQKTKTSTTVILGADMPRRSFKIPFAAAGETASIPTAAQPDGTVSLTQGYGPDYERPTDGTDPLAKVFPRLPYNGLMNEITASIGEIQQYGFPIWAADMAPYPINSWVRHNDQNWQSTLANNSSEPGSSGSGWIAAGTSGSGGSSQQVRITASTTFLVPQGVSVIYVSGCGGGGGGAGGAGRWAGGGKNSGGGGGGGGAGRSTIRQQLSVQAGQSYSVIIGTGGAGGIGGPVRSNGGNGGAGGATSIGSLLSLAGGGGGQGGLADFSGRGSGGSGGSPGGQWGTNGIVLVQGGDGGQGGSGPYGTAGGGSRGSSTDGPNPPTVGFGYGTGGGGGGGAYQAQTANGAAEAGSPGGAGMPGFMLIEW